MQQYTPAYEDIPVFSPSRAAPIYRRAVRRYPCSENLSLTKTFRTMNFKLNNSPDLVIRDIRLCMPLKLQVKNVGGEALQMRANAQVTTANIAVSSDPLAAFHQVELYVNGKRHAQRHSAYGHLLSYCYQSQDEIGFSDNNSLKPLLLRDPTAGVDVPNHLIPTYDPNGAVTGYVEMAHMQARLGSQAFNLLESNTGFLERCRRFQDGLSDDGKTWQGVITSKLNVGPFNAKTRGDDNSAYPYIDDLSCLFSFDQRISEIDAKYSSPGFHQTNAFASQLFQFATPVNIQHFGQVFEPAKEWIADLDLSWTAKAFLEVEFVEHRAMLPEYRLRAFQHESYSSSEVIAPIVHGQIRQTVTYPVSLSVRLTSVPTKIYVNAELVPRQRNAFIFGSTKRNCILENIKIRVNQAVDLVDGPTQKQCFEWHKLLTNNALLYPTWSKSPLYVFSSSQISHPEFLANNSGIMSFHISADMRVSQLQCEEYSAIEAVQVRGAGYQHDHDFLQVNSNGLSFYNATRFNRASDLFRFGIRAAQTEITPRINYDVGLSSFFDMYLRFDGQHEIWYINRANNQAADRFQVQNGVWHAYNPATNDWNDERYLVDMSDEFRFIDHQHLEIFSIAGEAARQFAVVENQGDIAWRPAARGVRIDAGAQDDQPHPITALQTNDRLWVCWINTHPYHTTMQINFDVSAVREQFGTARDGNIAAGTRADILNQQRTDTLNDLRWTLNGLFEYGNDQIVYRNALEVPEERTNLIPTAKAPGVF